jgi:hypothetical protein
MGSLALKETIQEKYKNFPLFSSLAYSIHLILLVDCFVNFENL